MKKRLMIITLMLTAAISLGNSPVYAAKQAANEETTEETTEETEDKEIEEAETQLVGGMTLNDSPAAQIPEDAQKAFDKATKNAKETTYEAIVLLGTQVVAGTNYCFLAKSTSVKENTDFKYVLLYIYEDLNGEAEITTETDLAL